jgi:hypothetical protein
MLLRTPAAAPAKYLWLHGRARSFFVIGGSAGQDAAEPVMAIIAWIALGLAAGLRRIIVKVLVIVVVVVVVLVLLGLALSARIVKQYEQGVLFRLGRVRGPREPGFRLIVPLVDVLHRVSLRIITMPIQSQGIITRDTRSPRPRCARWSGSTPWTRRCPRPTRSTWTYARSSRSPRPSGAWR